MDEILAINVYDFTPQFLTISVCTTTHIAAPGFSVLSIWQAMALRDIKYAF